MNVNGPRIFIVSDSIGETAKKVVKAVAIQFNSDITEIRKEANVTDKSQIVRIVEEAKNYNSIVVYTIVLPELKRPLKRNATGTAYPGVDILGPLMEALSKIATTSPRWRQALYTGLTSSTSSGWMRWSLQSNTTTARTPGDT